MADAFIETVRSGDVEAVKQLLLDGADPRGEGKHKRTGLHAARSVEMIQVLLDAGADINARDYNNETPLQNMVEEIKSIYGPATAPECIPLMLAAGADPNTKNYSFETILMCAVANDDRDTVELLLEARVNLEITESHTMCTALMFAETPEIAQLLLDAGAQIDHCNEWGRSPLHYCARYAKRCLGVLLAAGADPNAVCDQKNTPLHEAADTDEVEAARALIDAGVNRTARNQAGKTAADVATSSEMYAICIVATKGAHD